MEKLELKISKVVNCTNPEIEDCEYYKRGECRETCGYCVPINYEVKIEEMKKNIPAFSV